MSGISRKLLGTTDAGAGFLAIEDVFSTYLYTGNGSTQTITNGIDLAGEGGLVWSKSRSGAYSHGLYDTERGATKEIKSDADTAESTDNGVTAFNSDGYDVGARFTTNNSGDTYASWTFRKAPRFFDVVTYTGNGVAGRTVSHNLGTTVGSIFVKRTDTTSDWTVYHRQLSAPNPEFDYLVLNSTASLNSATSRWNDTQPTDSVFTLGNSVTVNASGGTYVAYLFAHDPLGPSGDGSDGLIACGSYDGNGGVQAIDLGWEPQWVLFKSTNTTGTSWQIYDNMRGVATGGSDNYLFANATSAEGSLGNVIDFTATGFDVVDGQSNLSGRSYIYIAIRRGPMRQPESGTEVFSVQGTSTNNAPRTWTPNFPVDMSLICWRNTYTSNKYIGTRMTGNTKYMVTNGTGAENTSTVWGYDANTGEFGEQVLGNPAGVPMIHWMFRRAPGFFDVVAYTGNGVAGRTVPHNLGVAPEMMIVKSRTDANSWYVYTQPTGNNGLLVLNSSTAVITPVASWNNTSPTDTSFTVDNSNSLNASGQTYIAYLFATLPGVSKVGVYTGTGESNLQTINCGFTGSARFVLIKKSGSGNWIVFDSARGITTATSDGILTLNTTLAESTEAVFFGGQAIQPDGSGFIVTSDDLNRLGDDYIFLAIA